MHDDIKKLGEMLRESSRAVFFGGAGVSTESGIPDFRSENGINRRSFRYPPEVMLSHDFLLQHPSEFYSFYRKTIMHPQALPNAAHERLAALEACGILRAVVTQNIDGLHQAAGSRIVLELHGSVHRNYCLRCKKAYPLRFVLESRDVPMCACGGMVRPDVVLYGEPLDGYTLSEASRYIREADMLIVGGTSLAVYPAAGLLQNFRGRRLVLINKTPTPCDDMAGLIIRESIGCTLGALE